MVEKSCSTPIQSYFRDRFLFLLISILCLLVIAPVFKGFIGIRLLMGVFTTAILISGVYAVSKKMSVTITASLLALPMFISTHDNWRGWGWQYQKKWGKTQREMVEFLFTKCKLTQHEIRVFLRCKESSVRGRLSEIRKKQTLQ